VTGGDSGYLRVWDAKTGEARGKFLDAPSAVDQLAFSPDGQWLVSGNEDGTLRWWSLRTGYLMRTVNENIGNMAGVTFVPDGSQVYSLGWDRLLQGWELKNGALHRFLKRKVPNSEALAVTPDQSLVATLGGEEKSIRIRNTRTGKLVQYITGHGENVTEALFSPDGKALISSSVDGTVKIWDVAEGICRHSLNQGEPVTAVALTKNGQYLASAGGGGSIRLWDARTGVFVRSLNGHRAAVTRLAFGPDGRLQSASLDGSMRQWDIFSGHCLRRRPWPATGTPCVFSPDGRLIASADAEGVIHVSNARTGQTLAEFCVLPFDASQDESGHEVSHNWIAFTSSGYYVASPHAETYIRWRDGDVLKPAGAFSGRYRRSEALAQALRVRQ
jgi:WD40 repeat protein